MISQDKGQLRGFFSSAWKKRQNSLPMEPLESMVADIIEQHPEYQRYIGSQAHPDQDFPEGETNPFLHMGMHITLSEQIGADSPQGIRVIHQKLSEKFSTAHQAEHEMMECLGLILWEAQRANQMPDEVSYVKCLKKLLIP